MTRYFPGKVQDRPTAEICSLRSQTALSILPPAARPAKDASPVLPSSPKPRAGGLGVHCLQSLCRTRVP